MSLLVTAARRAALFIVGYAGGTVLSAVLGGPR